MKYEHPPEDTSPKENENMGIYNKLWLSTEKHMTKCESQHKIHGLSEYHNEYTQPSENNNIGIYDQVLISIGRYMTIWEYQHGDIWPIVNINMGTYNNMYQQAIHDGG